MLKICAGDPPYRAVAASRAHYFFFGSLSGLWLDLSVKIFWRVLSE